MGASRLHGISALVHEEVGASVLLRVLTQVTLSCGMVGECSRCR